MTIIAWALNAGIKGLSRLICRVDDGDLSKVPASGPLILVANHVNFVVVPILFTHLQPRPITGLVKAETLNNPLFRVLFNVWGGIPVRRGEADLKAFRQAEQALADGKILAVAPEGTRSGHGRLQKGYPGIVLLALRAKVPLLPVAYYGGERVWQNMRSFKRTDFKIVVGNPFYLVEPAGVNWREKRQEITDQVMYQLAALLPPVYRGYYSDFSKAGEDFLRFPPGSESNLLRVLREGQNHRLGWLTASAG